MSQRVFVQEHGMLLPSGDSAQALLCATLAGVSAVSVIKDIAVAVGSDPRAHLPRLACMPDSAEWEEYLLQAIEARLARSDLLLLVMPEEGEPQYGWIAEVVSQADPDGKIEQVSGARLATVLAGHVDHLRAGEWASLSVLGVDSLVHPVSVMQRAGAGLLQTDKFPDGRAAGEGFAWFTLTTQPAPVEWISHAAGSEPQVAEQIPASFAGLAETIRSIPEAQPSRPRLIIHARAQTPQDDLEWHHASQRLWPNRLAPRDNLAMRKGERDAPQPAAPPWQQHLKPAAVVGELAAAAMPMAVALACERLCWPLSPAHEALVVDAGEQQSRLAVQLKNTESQGCDSNE